MKKHLFIFCCLLFGYQATTTTAAQSFKNFMVSDPGTATTATIGGYVIPATILAYFGGNPIAFLHAIPSFLGASVACYLQQKGISAKWGCNTTTRTGSIINMSTYFTCAFLADFIAHALVQKADPVDAVTRSALTTIGAYAALATRDSVCK